MKTILGLTKFTGTVKVNQTKVTENDHAALADVGALIEHPAIYPFLTGRQSLALYSQDSTDMQHLITALKMTTYINQKSKNYSLGMKQKLGIAIALLNKSKLVILDEPMNGLDVEATIMVRNLIQKYAQQGTTFLISSHILTELQKVMTRIILINHGEIILNQSINKFNHLSHQKYQVLVEKPTIVEKLLKQQSFPFTLKNKYFIVEKEGIFSIQDILSKNHLYLQELTPIEPNFEQIIVNILEQQRGQNHEA